MPKKDVLPKDMDDLEKIFYGPNKDGKNIDIDRQRRYLNWLKTQDLSPLIEQETRQILSSLLSER